MNTLPRLAMEQAGLGLLSHNRLTHEEQGQAMPHVLGKTLLSEQGGSASQAEKLREEGCKLNGLLIKSGQDALADPLEGDCAESCSPVALWPCMCTWDLVS